MQQGLFNVTAHFPGHARQRRYAAAVLANFDDPGGGKLLEAGLQFGREFHVSIIKEIRSCGTNPFLGADKGSVTSTTSTTDDEPLDQRLREVGGTHALLDEGNIVRHAPKLDDLVFHVGDGKSGARITVTRLSDRTGIQEIAAR